MTRAGRFAALWICAAAVCAAGAGRAAEPEMPYSRYHGTVLRVIDGDTLVVQVRIWPRLTAEYAVRVRGIDAPEIHRPGCAAERRQGKAAKAFVQRFYPVGLTVRLENVESGAFSGRVVADLARRQGDDWLSLRDEMISAGMAVAWTPGKPQTRWCDLAENAAPAR